MTRKPRRAKTENLEKMADDLREWVKNTYDDTINDFCNLNDEIIGKGITVKVKPFVDQSDNVWYLSESGGNGHEKIMLDFKNETTLRFNFPEGIWFQMDVKPQVVLERDRYKNALDITMRFLELWNAAFEYHFSPKKFKRLEKLQNWDAVKTKVFKDVTIAAFQGEITDQLNKLIEKVI